MPPPGDDGTVSGPVSEPDTVGDALRADADDARAEIRAAGVTCPSCGVNMADLPRGHMLAYEDSPERSWTAQCSHGKLVTLAGKSPMTDAEYQTWQAVANISLYDQFRNAEDEAFSRMLGFDVSAP
jgi:hypothetical protein